MTESVMRRGGCLCGAVRYELQGEPYKSGICHCGDCRKVTGTASLHYADWRPHQFTVKGEVHEFRGRSFCPTCGSRLFSLASDQVEIYLGTLDDAPNGLSNGAEIWIKRREPWLAPLHVPQYEEDKP